VVSLPLVVALLVRTVEAGVDLVDQTVQSAPITESSAAADFGLPSASMVDLISLLLYTCPINVHQLEERQSCI
jgi:hypothetical protein